MNPSSIYVDADEYAHVYAATRRLDGSYDLWSRSRDTDRTTHRGTAPTINAATDSLINLIRDTETSCD